MTRERDHTNTTPVSRLSIYKNTKDTTGRLVTLSAVIKRIRDGARGLSEKTRISNALAPTTPKKYKAYKEKNLPAVTFSGIFPKRKRQAVHLATHSGLITIDIDGLPPSMIPDLLAELAQMPHVVLAFVSPSGLGIKVIVRVDPIPQDDIEHKGAYQACLDFFEDLSVEYGFEIDTSGSDCSRLCFLAHDPLAIVNENAIPITWDREAYLEALQRQEAERQRKIAVYDNLPVDATALDFIDPDTATLPDLSAPGRTLSNYDTWVRIGLACKSTGLPFEVWDAWSARGAKYNPTEMQKKWNSFASTRDGKKVSWGAVVLLAKENGYEPPRRSVRKPVKLKKNIVSLLTETLDKSRAFLTSVFENKKIKFFGLRADTGVGKNQAAISFFLRGFRGLLTVPTTDLAKELQARFDAAEIDSFRYRGLLSNPDGAFPDENPCIHAVRYDAIASRGWNAFELLCAGCEVRDICEERGYRSQPQRAKEAQVTVMPFPDIFLNPAFRTLAKEFLPTYSDDLILHDEFDPYNAFLQIDVPKSRLVQLRDDWKGYDPSMFAKELLRILEVEGELSELRSLVMELTDAEREAILEGLTCVMFNGQILSREDAHRCEAFQAKMQNTEQILTLPRLETEDWNLLVQLELFFQRYPRDTDMPMKYENDTLTFLLPPLPMPTRARMGFMSATLDETLFRRTFSSRQAKRGDVTFHDTGFTEWHKDAKVFQLRTNRNPRATAYTPKGQRVDGDLLSPTGEFYWGLVREDLEKPNRGLITYKALLEEKALEVEGITTANFGGLVGLDTHFKEVEVLHLLFSPELPPSAVDFKVKALFGNDTEPLCFDRDENGHSIDTRLQQCYDDGVISELLQAFGRGRAVSRLVLIVIWCSHYLPGITDRPQTRLFDETDWEVAGGVRNLASVVAEREGAEFGGDPKAYAEATGQSERTAYRQTEQTRKQSKAERDAQLLQRILEIKAQQPDFGERKIAEQLGIKYGKVRTLLKNNEVH